MSPRIAEYASAFKKTGRLLARFWYREDGGEWSFVTLSARHDEDEVDVRVEHMDFPFELTRRELEVLTLIAGGLSNAQIAERLVTSPHTVTTHVEHILAKLALPTRAAAAALAAEHGLFLLPAPGGGRGLEALTIGMIERAV